MSEVSNTPSTLDAEVQRRRDHVSMRLSIARSRAESIDGWLDDPWVWAVLGPSKLGRIKDAVAEIREALNDAL